MPARLVRQGVVLGRHFRFGQRFADPARHGRMREHAFAIREKWDRAKAMGWFRRPEAEDDEKRLRDQEARLGEGRGGTRGVERWREQVFGRQAEEEEGGGVGMRDQGRECLSSPPPP